MSKPLRTEDTAPQSQQFKHFGVLNDGSQSKTSLVTSITLNVIIALVVIIIGAAAKTSMDRRAKLTRLVEPIPMKKSESEPLKPKIIPKPLPPTPKIKIDPPKINIPQVKLPDLPKPPELKMVQQPPVVLPAPPKVVTPPPAPKIVNLAQAQAASVVNNSPHPTAVALGHPDNPIAPSSRTGPSAINLGNKGLAGMPASNSGMGPSAHAVNLGSGSAGSQNMNGHDNASAVRGVKLGVTGGTGPLNSPRVAGPVNLGQNQPPPMPKPAGPSAPSARSAPKVLFKPRPQYTDEAVKLHLEGTVSVRLRVASSGAVEVLGVSSGLGHGLDESAIRAVQATRFQPATDASGQPVDWEGVVNVIFQLAG